MPNILIRDLPDDVHAELVRRAAQEGKSLQQYLLGELVRLTSKPTIAEVMDRIAARSGGRVGNDVVKIIEEERAARDERLERLAGR